MTVNTDATAIEPLNQECKIKEESPAFSGIRYKAGTLFFNHCLNRNGFKSALEFFLPRQDFLYQQIFSFSLQLFTTG